MKKEAIHKIFAVMLALILGLNSLSYVTADEIVSDGSNGSAEKSVEAESINNLQNSIGISDPAAQDTGSEFPEEGRILLPGEPDITENDLNEKENGLLSWLFRSENNGEDKTVDRSADHEPESEEKEENPSFADYEESMEAFLRSVRVIKKNTGESAEHPFVSENTGAESKIENSEGAPVDPEGAPVDPEEVPVAPEEDNIENESEKQEKENSIEEPSGTDALPQEKQEDKNGSREMETEASLHEEAEADIITGTCGADVSWTLDTETGVLTVTGQGDMDSYSASPWKSYAAQIKSLSIEDGVTGIGAYAFAALTSLTNVSAADSIERIGYRSFYNCTVLSAINIPINWNSCPSNSSNGTLNTTYCGHIFEGCRALTEITVPDRMTSLPAFAFTDCNYLKKVNLPDSFEELPNHVFYGCSALTEAKIPNGTVTIRKSLFYNCYSLTEIVIPDGVTEIASYAFFGCNGLKNITIPEGITAIWEYAFYNCNKIETLHLPDSIEKLGYQVFYNCSKLNSINIPTSWNECPSNDSNGTVNADHCGHIFEGCRALTNITVPEGMTSLPAYAFNKCNYLKIITLPESMGELPNHVFYNCTALERVSLPAQTKTISRSLFCYCSSLQEVDIPDGVTEIRAFAFYECKALSSVSLPDSVERIGYQAFADCVTLAEINIPKNWNDCPSNHTNGEISAEYCGHIFEGCSSLTEVTIPEGMTSLPSFAFCKCNYLKKINLPETMGELPNHAFYQCESLERIELPKDTKIIKKSIFLECFALQEVIIPDGVTDIAAFAFANCKSLISVKLPDSIERIGYQAFCDCESLTDINIPKNWNECPTSNTNGVVNSDGCGHIFQNCHELDTVILPEGMETVPKYAFCYSDGINYVKLSHTIKKIELAAFYNCTGLVSVDFSDSVSEIGNYAFGKCSALRAADFPASLTTIGEYAFLDCTDLAAVIFSDGITTIADNAFEGCSLLTNVYYSGTEADWNNKINQGSGSPASSIFSGKTITFNILCDYKEPDYIIESSYTKPADSDYDSFYGGVTYDNGTTHYLIDLQDVSFGPRHNEKFVSLPRDSYITYGFRKAMLCPDNTAILITTVGIVQERGDVYVRLQDGSLQFIDTIYENSEKHTIPLTGINGMITGIKVVGRDLDGDSPGFDIVNIALVAQESDQNADAQTKTTVTIQRNGKTEDLLKNTCHIDHDSEEEVTILVSADWDGHAPGTIALVQNSQVVLQNKGGAFVDIAPGKVFESTGSVFVVLLDADDNLVDQLKTGLDLSDPGSSRKSAIPRKTRLTVFENRSYSTDKEDNYILSDDAEAEADGTIYLIKKGFVKFPTIDSGTVRIAKGDYITRKFTPDQLKKNKTICLQKVNDNGPVISGVWVDNYDILNTNYDLSMISKKEITLTLEIDWGTSKAGSVKLLQEQRTVSFSGDTLTTVISDNFNTSDTIYITAVDAAGRMTKRPLKFINGTDIRVANKMSGASIEFGDKLSFTMPDDFEPSFFAGNTFSANLTGLETAIPFSISAENGKIYAAIGVTLNERHYSNEGGKKENKTTNFAKRMKKTITGRDGDASDQSDEPGIWDASSAKESLKKLKNIKKEYKDAITAPKGKFGVDATFTVLGFAEGTYDDNGSITWLDSGIIVNPSVSVSKDLPFTLMVGPIPVPLFFETSFSADILGKLNLYVHENAKRFTSEGELSGTITLSGGLGVGMKKVLYASGGLEGNLKPDYKIYLNAQNYFLLKASVNGYAKAGIACFEGKWKFGEKEAVWVEEPKGGKLAAASEEEMELSAEDNSENIAAASITDPDSYTQKDLGYLEDESIFTANSESDDEEVFKTNIYRESTPQYVSLPNGEKIAVWTDSADDDVNNIRLYYSVLKNGAWSSPKAVLEDGTMDYEPCLKAIGGKVYLVWQNATTSFNEDTLSLDGIAGAFDIAAALYHEDTDTFASVNLPCEYLDLMPVVCGEGNEVYAVWVNNTENDWFGYNSANRIMMSRFDGENWSAPVEKHKNLHSIGALDADVKEGLNIAWSADEDSNPETVDDMKVYENGEKISGNGDADLPYYSDHVLYWYENGNIVSRKTEGTEGDIQTRQFEIVERDGDRAMLYILSEGLTSTLMISYYNPETNVWSKGTALTDGKGFIGSFSTDYSDDGSIDVLYNESKVIGTYDSEDPYGEAILRTLKVQAAAYLAIGDVYYKDDTFYAGKSMPFEVEIINNGSHIVRGMVLSVKDTIGNILAEKEIPDAITPGEMINTGIEYEIDESVKEQEIVIEVRTAGQTEINGNDNVKKIPLSFERAYLENLNYGYSENGKVIISADVVNRGYHDKEKLTVSLLKNSLDGDLVEKKQVETLGELELSTITFELEAKKGDVFYLALNEEGKEENEDSDFIHIFTDYKGSEEENVNVQGIKLEKTSLEIPAGQSVTLKATVTPSNATNRNVTWTTSNEKIAAVDATGKITAKSMGRVTITATTEDGQKKASCNVRVLFSDVTNKNLAAYDAIYWGADKGYVNGYGSYFDINGNCTRAQFVLFLWRAAGKPKASTTTLKFKDKADIEKLAPDYKKAILWGSEKGVVAGFTSGANAGKFLPNDPCTRGQVVTFLWRYGGQKAAKSGAKTFPDVPKTHKYYKAVMWASSYGITTGFSDGKFKPDQKCTRGQCVTFLYRMLK